MVSRRALLAGLPVTSLALATPSFSICAETPADERLRYHLAAAAAIMRDMIPSQNSRWWLSGFGDAGPGLSFCLQRFDLTPDPEIPSLMIERLHDVFEFRAGNTA